MFTRYYDFIKYKKILFTCFLIQLDAKKFNIYTLKPKGVWMDFLTSIYF